MKVLVVDDNPIIRIGLRQVLEQLDEVDAVAEADNGLSALEQAAGFGPDLVLLDVRMPVMGGLEALPRLAGSAAVIMLTNDSDQETVTKALDLGARGYLVYGALGMDQVRGALATCRAGGLVLGPEAAGVLADGARAREPGTPPRTNPLVEVLTAREAEVLEAAARGLGNAEIAREQFLSPRTVKNYLNAAYTKLGVHTRAEAVVAWHEAAAPQDTGQVSGRAPLEQGRTRP